jgi:hypothetical protein
MLVNFLLKRLLFYCSYYPVLLTLYKMNFPFGLAEKFGQHSASLGRNLFKFGPPIAFRGRTFGPLVMVTLSLTYDWLSFGERCREVEPEDYYLTVDSLDPAIIAFAPVAGSKDPRWVQTTLIKKKTKFASYVRKFRWDRLQCHI